MIDLSEREFQTQLVELGHILGWRSNHVRPCIDSKRGWRTPTTAIGWPDLTFARLGRLVFVECKGARTPVTDAQREWIALLDTVPGCSAVIARPADFDAVAALLR